LEARSLGFPGPGEPNFHREYRPTFRHRGALPVSRLAIFDSRSRTEEHRHRRLPTYSDDLAPAASPPQASLQRLLPSHQVDPPPLPLSCAPARVVSPLFSPHLFLVDPVEAEQARPGPWLLNAVSGSHAPLPLPGPS